MRYWSLVGFAVVLFCATSVTATTYYVDYDQGADTKAGTSKDAAWKHAPGDPQAVANPAKAGDTVRLKGGVIYRGSIVVKWSGEEGKPVTLDGNADGTYGQGRAVLDGSEPVTGWTACKSAADCDGNPNWRHIYQAFVPAGVKPGSANLCEADKLCWLAQDPNQPDPFYSDKAKHFYKVPNKNVTPTSIVDPSRLNQKDEHAWDDAYVFLWARPNVTYKKKITQFIPAENKIVFDKAGQPYDDREELYSLVNSLRLLDRPGEYVVRAKAEADGRFKVFFWPYAEADMKGDAVTVSVRQVGVNAGGTRYVTIQGLQIQKFSGAVQFDRAGIGVSAGHGTQTSNLIVRNNLITHLRHADRGYGGVFLDNARDCLIEGNEITESPLSMGILVGGSSGIVTKNNLIRKAGGQNIWYMGCKNSKIIGNEVRDGQGTHANGISVYSGCDGIDVIGNRVFDSNIPFTFETSRNITVAYNVFDGGGAHWVCVCWSDMDHVKIFNNVFVNAGGGGGLVIRNSKGTDFIVKTNIMTGFAAKPEFDVSNNLYLGKARGQSPLRRGEILELDLNKVFVDAAKRDFRLKPGSPAIDAGAAVGLKEDVVGTKVPQGKAPDIGAYEFTPPPAEGGK